TNNEVCHCSTLLGRRVFLEAFAIDMLSPSSYYESSCQYIWVEAWSSVHGCRLSTMTRHTAKAPQEALSDGRGFKTSHPRTLPVPHRTRPQENFRLFQRRCPEA